MASLPGLPAFRTLYGSTQLPTARDLPAASDRGATTRIPLSLGALHIVPPFSPRKSNSYASSSFSAFQSSQRSETEFHVKLESREVGASPLRAWPSTSLGEDRLFTKRSLLSDPASPDEVTNPPERMQTSMSSSSLFSNSSSEGGSTAEWVQMKQAKKAKRKEQCRVNQANYRKRKRMYENELADEIKKLEAEIQDLKIKRVALSKSAALEHGPSRAATSIALDEEDPEQAIRDFYFQLGKDQQEYLNGNPRRACGITELFVARQADFDSMSEFQRQWIRYRDGFELFYLTICSSKQLQIGNHVVIKISAKLHLQLPDSQGMRLVCPVHHEFEFHAQELVVTRISSEIDWIAGAASVAQQSKSPENILCTLNEILQSRATAQQACYEF